MNIIKLIVISLLGLWGIVGAFHPPSFMILDGANLLFHESGHVIFSMFGEFIHYLGGTLFQIGFPAVLGIIFLKREDLYSACVLFWWSFQNFFGTAIYIKDARAQVLELVGGGDHDWTYLLSAMHVLHHNIFIGNLMWLIGFTGIIASTLVGIAAALQSPSRSES